MITIQIEERHIAILKRHPFLTLHYASLAHYDGDHDRGWLKVGMRVAFAQEISIEPYSAIYTGGFVGGLGVGNSHGLCSVGTQSYSYSALPEQMSVGRYCSIAGNLRFLDSHHPARWASTAHFAWRPSSPIVALAARDDGLPIETVPFFNLIGGGAKYPIVGNDVWIGQNVTIAMGVTIGDGAILAANSVITRDVAPFSIVAGNPGRLKGYRFSSEIVDRFIAAAWWQYAPRDLRGLDYENPARFISDLERRTPDLSPYRPTPLVLPRDFL